MSVVLEGSHICRAVKMALHISENAVLDCPSGKVDHPALLISFKN